MSDVSTWSPTDEANTSAPPNGWPEFMMPAMVNNSARAMMGAVRRMYDSQVDGSLVLPYLKLSGGTVTGAVVINGATTVNGGLTSSSLGVGGNITAVNIGASGSLSANSLTVAGNITSNSLAVGGNLTAVNIGASNNIIGANVTASGTVDADHYDIHGTAFAVRSGGGTMLDDADGQYTLILSNTGDNFYANTGHRFVNRGNTATYTFINASGLTVFSGGVSAYGPYADLSDASLKTQIEPATQGLAEILQLQPKTFVRKPWMEGAPQRQELGFVAQDVQQALPLAVVEVDTPDGPVLGVTSGAIVAALINAMKTIDQRLTAGGL